MVAPGDEGDRRDEAEEIGQLGEGEEVEDRPGNQGDDDRGGGGEAGWRPVGVTAASDPVGAEEGGDEDRQVAD